MSSIYTLQLYNNFKIRSTAGDRVYIYVVEGGNIDQKSVSHLFAYCHPKLTGQDILTPCLAERVHCEP